MGGVGGAAEEADDHHGDKCIFQAMSAADKSAHVSLPFARRQRPSPPDHVRPIQHAARAAAT